LLEKRKNSKGAGWALKRCHAQRGLGTSRQQFQGKFPASHTTVI
jgi:hypothetical protein